MSNHTSNSAANDPSEPLCSAIQQWLVRQLKQEDAKWLTDQIDQLSAIEDVTTDPAAKRQFDIAFGFIPRRLGKSQLELTNEERKQAQALLPQWQPWTWQLSDAARILLMAKTGARHTRTKHIKSLLRHADVSEQLAIFRGLPLYPVDEILVNVVGEGLRSNMSVVFESIAHNNPFPVMEFDEHRFNHMVLKALFIETPLHPIVGLAQRNNPELTRMLLDYASERMAANRPVAWELWRLVTPYATVKMLEPFKPILSNEASQSDELRSQHGLTLALSQCTDADPTQDDSGLTWDALLLDAKGQHN